MFLALVDPRRVTDDDNDEKGRNGDGGHEPAALRVGSARAADADSEEDHSTMKRIQAHTDSSRDNSDAVSTRAASAATCPFHCATEHDDRNKKNKFFNSLQSNFRATVEAGLTVAVDSSTNKPMIWGSVRTNLTWSCDTRDVEQYSNDIAAAFASWSKACNVVFKKVQSNGFITVRWATKKEADAGEGVIAAAFFPGERDRSIKLYPLFKTQDNFRIAVLRHEIGHALGFRHEHIWFDDNPTDEQPESGGLGAELVTKVDRDSVMSYLKLWEDSRVGRVTDLSHLDIIGSRLLYGAPATIVHMLM